MVASIVFLLVRSESMLGPAVGIAIPVALLSGLLASFPFIASGHIGIPGVGLNNDMAMHLVDVDYLVDPSRPKPQSVINGYPLGPHSLVGTVVSVLGTQPLWGWLGLLVVVPVLTAITRSPGSASCEAAGACWRRRWWRSPTSRPRSSGLRASRS